MKEKKPLYRKVNTRARNHHHYVGPDAKDTRNTKAGLTKKMRSDVQRGYDYTPLFKFLLSKVGQKWDNVFSEAISRLDKQDPIFWMVKVNENLSDLRYGMYYFQCGESSKYSILYVDEDGLLQKLDPNLKNEDFTPSCPCCTHTFNGKVLNNKYIAK